MLYKFFRAGNPLIRNCMEIEMVFLGSSTKNLVQKRSNLSGDLPVYMWYASTDIVSQFGFNLLVLMLALPHYRRVTQH